MQKKPKMIKRTIHKSLFLSAILSALCAVTAMMVIVSVLTVSSTKNDLINMGKHAAEYVNMLDDDDRQSFFHHMYDGSDKDRVTIIRSDGTVLYDSDVDLLAMENHLARPEVRDAIEYGSGQASRSSETVGDRVYYYAVKLDDGTIIRLSRELNSINYTIYMLLPASLLLIALIVTVTWYVSRKITSAIMKPVYGININNIDKDMLYGEFIPFFERIEAENAEKEKTETIRREFSANVSHELKTPLTSISGYAQMIGNGMVQPDDVAMFGLKIEKEADRLILLIEDIIRLSNLDETAGIAEPENVRLDEVVSETINHLEPQIERKDVHVFYSGDESVIKGVRTLIGELCYNIIDNAIKYNKPDGRIDVYVGKSPLGTEFSVSDTGIGIAEDDLDRVFERFYRVDKSHSKTVGGTGLGLSIVKHVAMVHDAKIDIKSELGKGTTIKVVFKPMG